jgi:dienelactone hydrolase
MDALSFRKTFLISTVILTVTSMVQTSSLASTIREETVTYSAGGVTFKGYLAYDGNIKGKRPAILVVHEWWGLTDYPKMRARELAELGYIALAVDLFGDGKVAVNPKEAQEFTTPFYKDPQLAKTRLDAALKKLKEYPQTDPQNMAAIGYCFGGFVVLNYAKMGADLKGVASFHGGLGGVPVDKTLLKAKLLICAGESDQFVSRHDIDAFTRQLDSIGAVYTLKMYPNAMHAFTNPGATEAGKKFNLPIAYNAEADKASWADMKVFLNQAFQK